MEAGDLSAPQLLMFMAAAIRKEVSNPPMTTDLRLLGIACQFEKMAEKLDKANGGRGTNRYLGWTV